MTDEQVLRIEHWIATDPETVWNAWTTPDLFHRFFSPEGLHIPLESVLIEPWVGGRFECTMIEDATGVEHANIGVLTEVERPHRIVGAEPTIGFRSVQTFTAEDGGTTIRVEQFGLPAELIGNPEVHAAFRSSYRKLGTLLGVDTAERPCH